VREVGCAIIGQTADLAPADRRLYAIRDVTGTVESLDLLTSSILSKKFAAGLSGLAMDVTFGSGAFMDSLEGGRALADSIVQVARGAGLPITALLTDMNQPLASAVGNAVEVAYALDYLTGRRRESRFHEVTIALAAEMLLLGRIAPTIEAAKARVEDVVASGRAAEVFSRMVAALGGPADFVEHSEKYLARAPIVGPVHPEGEGIVQEIATREIGVAEVALGGGRTRPEDKIDHAVGFTELAGVGKTVGAERPLGVVHARSDSAFEAAAAALRRAYRLGDEPVFPGPVIAERIA
jgi:thymidine phosphorylase